MVSTLTDTGKPLLKGGGAVWAHRALALVESIPVLGGIIALVEYLASLIFSTKSDKSGTDSISGNGSPRVQTSGSKTSAKALNDSDQNNSGSEPSGVSTADIVSHISNGSVKTGDGTVSSELKFD